MEVTGERNLNAEIASSHGALITRLTRRHAPVDSSSPRHPEAHRAYRSRAGNSRLHGMLRLPPARDGRPYPEAAGKLWKDRNGF